MTDDDASKRDPTPDDSAAPILLIPPGKARPGPVLELIEDPPSATSLDDVSPSVPDPPGSGLGVEDNEPLVLARAHMLRSGGPPPLPRPASLLELPRGSSKPPPLPPEATTPLPSPAVDRADEADVAHRRGTSPVPAPARPSTASPVRVPSRPSPRRIPHELPLEGLRARVAALEAESDAGALSRALADLAIAQDIADDVPRAIASARAALEKDASLGSMHALLRRRLMWPADASEVLAHINAEIALTQEGALRTSLLAERARALAALDRHTEAVVVWSAVLERDPRHGAALRGKEAALTMAGQDAPRWAEIAEHIAAMADACVGDRRLSAWLLVERAGILEGRLDRGGDGRRALTKAVAIDPRVGPARRALVRHVLRSHDTASLVDLLDDEATVEADPRRAARLELEASVIARWTMRDVMRAIQLLERAATRAPTDRDVDARVFGDLCQLLEATGRDREAARWRRVRVPLLRNPADRAFERRAAARSAEAAGDVDAAIADLEASLVDAPDDGAACDLDRLLAGSGRHEARLALWVAASTRSEDPTRRVDHLLQAAAVAEREVRRPDEATRLLRTAWTTRPGHPEVLEGLSRLLARPSEDPEARTRMELFAHAAEVADDRATRIACLDRVALLAEETFGDHSRAATTYQKILALEPSSVGALLGLRRCAARLGDERTVHRTLLEQARLSRSETEALSLKVRAAASIASIDPAVALSLAGEVLGADATHEAAHALVVRLHQQAGRWDMLARALEGHAALGPVETNLDSLLRLAELQTSRLRAPGAALDTLVRARRGHPGDARVLSAMTRVAACVDDPATLRDAYLELAAASAPSPEKAAALIKAAEISEHALTDDVAASHAYEDALLASPGDPLVVERLSRLGDRRPGSALSHPLDRALEVVLGDTDGASVRASLDAMLAQGDEPAAVTRLLERIHRRAKSWGALDKALRRQVEVFDAPESKSAALWALAEVEARATGAASGPGTFGRILAVSPDDLAALSAVARLLAPAAASGDDGARRAVVDALARRVSLESDDTRLATDLWIAQLTASHPGDADDDSLASALARCKDALGIWPSSLLAASLMLHLAQRAGRASEAADAAVTLAELATTPQTRCRYLVTAADALTKGADEGRKDEDASRKGRAAGLLVQALRADPRSVEAAGALAALSRSSPRPEALMGSLEEALARAEEPSAVVNLGTEVARVARDVVRDLGAATRAMQRVKDAAPDHVPSLMALAELCAAQDAWAEAADAYEAVVVRSHLAPPRLAALGALGDLYDKVLRRPADHERTLRSTLALQPEHPRALRALIDVLRARLDAAGDAPREAEAATREELAKLLERLAALRS